MTTPLGRAIAAEIAAEGPMRLDRYMALCLGHPVHGYYATRDPFGRGGDFVTAPEISQMFGELIGLWAADVWALMGAPGRVLLVELGPGRGTLMADFLRAARVVPGFREALDVVLVETSAALRGVQAKTLEGAGAAVRWAGTIDEALTVQNPSPGTGEGRVGCVSGSSSVPQVPSRPRFARPPSPLPRGRDQEEAPALVIANEFFDALPIRQFVRTDRGWRERLIGLDGERLAFGLAPDAPCDLALPDAPEGSVREVSPESLTVAARIAGHVTAHGGACLAIDYGYAAAGGDTLQALKGHAFADPLAAPGEADLTAHVDFSALAAAATRGGAAVMTLLPQAELLERLGLAARAHRLSDRAASVAQRGDIFAAAQRLTDRSPRGMGALFKALAFGDSCLGALPGFELAAVAKTL